ncbi:putative papain-like cysteine peptidase superfamily [Helianthus anomalus]
MIFSLYIVVNLFCHTDCYAEDLLCNPKYGDAEHFERFRSALFLVVVKKVSHMKLTDCCVICFVILELGHFCLVCFDMEKDAITVIDNMVKDVCMKYLKLVNHPKFLSFKAAIPKRLDFEWPTVGNSVDCGVFVMRHMETWFGVTDKKWDSGFPLSHKEKKDFLTCLKKKYMMKLVCSKVNKHHDRIMAEVVEDDKVSKKGFNLYAIRYTMKYISWCHS